MKITISFTTEEKSIIYNMMMSTGNIKEITDNNEHYSGNFGEVKYDNSKNEITFDLKTAFIKATTCLMTSVIGMIKAFVGSCEMYSSAWLEDVKDLTKKEDKPSEQKIPE